MKRIATLAVLSLCPLWAGHTLTAEHQKTLAAWLAAGRIMGVRDYQPGSIP